MRNSDETTHSSLPVIDMLLPQRRADTTANPDLACVELRARSRIWIAPEGLDDLTHELQARVQCHPLGVHPVSLIGPGSLPMQLGLDDCHVAISAAFDCSKARMIQDLRISKVIAGGADEALEPGKSEIERFWDARRLRSAEPIAGNLLELGLAFVHPFGGECR